MIEVDSPVEISVVIPVYNNAESLDELTAELIETLQGISTGFEVVYVNDGSKDTSAEVLKRLSAQHPQVKSIILSRNFGQHPAICAGFEHVAGQIIVLMDADLQDRPKYIPDLINTLKSTGADVAYSVKVSPENRSTSHLTSKLYHYLFSRLVQAYVPMNIGTYRAFTRKFLNAALQFKEVNVLYGPLMFYMGFKSSFIELPNVERPHGKSGYTFAKRLRLAVNSLISYTDIPHRASMWLGGGLLGASALYGVLVVLQYLLLGSRMPGGSTLILLVLCLTLGSVMLSLGIIGSYVYRVYQEVLRRPRYLVQDKFNIP